MGSVRLRKVVRDVLLARGRAATVVVAIGLSVTALGAVMGAYAVLARDMGPSFLATNPASATLVLAEPIDDQLLGAVRQRPGIADVQARALVSMRAEVEPDHWYPLSVFVVEDFSTMRIETIAPLDGAWPPPTGTFLIERTAVPVLTTASAATLNVQTSEGAAHAVRVSGIVSDPALAPAWQEQRGYAYASRATLDALGAWSGLDQLKVTVSGNRFDRGVITDTARDLATWLSDTGASVEEIRIPPPGEHSHQRLIEALVMVLLVFTLFLFGLSGVVIATLISGMLSRHVRQIGALKAIGADARQIAAMYSALVLLLGAAAVVLSLPLSTLVAGLLATTFAELSNVTLTSLAVPWWVYLVQLAAGLLLPLAAAAQPVTRASSITVREAIGDVPLYSLATGGGATVARLRRLSRVFGPTVLLAMRGTLRRRSRLVMSVSLLAVGGALFMAGLNVAAAGDARMAVLESMRGYDIDVTLNRPAPTQALLDLASGVTGVAYVEPLDFVSVSPIREGELPISTTHKDGGHGSMPLWAVPPTTRYPNTLLAGRALQPDDLDAVVVGRGTLSELQAQIGGSVLLAIDGKPTRWQVVGIVQAFGLAANAGVYASEAGFARAAGESGMTRGLRIETLGHDAAAHDATLRDLTLALRASDLSIASDMRSDWINTVLRNHIAIVQGALQFLGLLVGAVGAFTLAAAISTSVVERAREFGVMQTLGATPARIVAVVVAEGLFVGLLSWLVAVAATALLSYALGAVVGVLLFD
ncbi:MAG TPA: ABC transporter permease, partial [Chloroflexota bacterium]|nr:ABC transporter permease [Chloroflexota bacterium]